MLSSLCRVGFFPVGERMEKQALKPWTLLQHCRF